MAKVSAQITISRIVDIEKTTRYYLLQSSTASAPSVPTTNPPGGNWVTTEPTYTSGQTNTLYFVDLTIFTNGAYKYSAVSVSSSYEAAKDAYNNANDAKKTATNYLKTTTAGLIVGNMTDNILGHNVLVATTGVNVRYGETILASYGSSQICLGQTTSNNLLIDTSGIDIRQGSTILASFESNEISLGKNSSDTTINLCNSMVRMHYDVDIDNFMIESSTAPITIMSPNGIGLITEQASLHIYDQEELRINYSHELSDGSIIGRELLMHDDAVTITASTETDSSYVSSWISLTTDKLELINCDLCVSNEIVLTTNHKRIYGVNTSGEKRSLLSYNNLNNTILGYGGYDASEGGTYVYGNRISLIAKKDTSLPITLDGYVVMTRSLTMPNDYAIHYLNSSGEKRNVLYLSSGDYLNIGYGGYANGDSSTYIYGNNIYIASKAAGGVSYKPYFAAGDELTIAWTGAGYVGNYAKTLYFTIPLPKVAIGSPTVTVTTSAGIRAMQSGKYLYGTTSQSSMAIPSSYTATLGGSGSVVRVQATYDNATNAINMEAVAIYASITITFS